MTKVVSRISETRAQIYENIKWEVVMELQLTREHSVRDVQGVAWQGAGWILCFHCRVQGFHHGSGN